VSTPTLNERKETVVSTAPNEQALAVVVAWLDAMRRSDLEAAARCFHPDVTWRAVRDAALCSTRSEVVDMLADGLTTGVPRASALELIAGETAVVVGVRSDDLREMAVFWFSRLDERSVDGRSCAE
jgi:ketosteroid isomerase-like protein